MDNLIYVSASGASQIIQAQMVEANNLANVNTPGFREDFHTASAKSLQGEGLESRVYSVSSKGGSNLAPGAMMKTGRDLDLAIKGEGWFAVQTPQGERYTRAGNLEINPNGQLTTSNGLPVLGNGGPISIPPAAKINFGSDGTISILPAGDSGNTMATIDRIKLVKPDPKALFKGEDGLFYVKDVGVSPPDASVTIDSGYLESSNVNSIDALVNFISLSRQFEMQMKLIDNAKQNSDHTAQLLQT